MRTYGTDGMTLGPRECFTRDISRSNTVKTWGRAGYIDFTSSMFLGEPLALVYFDTI